MTEASASPSSRTKRLKLAFSDYMHIRGEGHKAPKIIHFQHLLPPIVFFRHPILQDPNFTDHCPPD